MFADFLEARKPSTVFDANLVLVDGDEFVQRAHHDTIAVAV